MLGYCMSAGVGIHLMVGVSRLKNFRNLITKPAFIHFDKVSSDPPTPERTGGGGVVNNHWGCEQQLQL